MEYLQEYFVTYENFVEGMWNESGFGRKFTNWYISNLGILIECM